MKWLGREKRAVFVVIMVRRKRKAKLCLASRLRRSIINGKLDTSQGAKAKGRTLTGGQGRSYFNLGAGGGFLA